MIQLQLRVAGLVCSGVVCIVSSVAKAQAAGEAVHSSLVYPGEDGRLVYVPDERGDTIPDFSNVGYMGGGVRIPEVPVRVTVQPVRGDRDDTARIQAAIDQVSAMPVGRDGFRGAVLMRRGEYRVDGSLEIAASGVVLRGEEDGENGTVLLATGREKRTLIQVRGSDGPRAMEETRVAITDERVPVGARSFNVEDPSFFSVGDKVFVTRVGNAAWISEIGMDRITPNPRNPEQTRLWTPFNLNFDRIITAIEGSRITIDAPIVNAIERQWGGGSLVKFEDAGRIEQVGIEHLRSVSEFDPSIRREHRDREYYADEDHAARLVSFQNVKNAWARDLTTVHYDHGPAAMGGGSKWITVQDCRSLAPASIITGGRRYAYSIDAGQLILVQRCFAEEARHAFVVGARVPGPNVFFDCRSEREFSPSEPHHRWSVGGLYDNVHDRIAIQDRQWWGTGHGWAGANYVVWNCTGSLVLQQPPTAQNWAIGFVGRRGGAAFGPKPDGFWESEGEHVEPRSLYLKQLEDRLDAEAVANAGKVNSRKE